MNAEPMDCVDLVELVTAYLDDAVDEQTRTDIEAHLEICEGCAEYVSQIRTTVGLAGKSSADEPIDPEFRAKLLAAFRDFGQR